MLILRTILDIITYAIVAVILGIIVLMVIRLIINYADLNPFTWIALTVRRMTDPLVSPVQRALAGFGLNVKLAPLVTILLVILVGWFAVLITESVLNTIAGIMLASSRASIVAVIGYFLYGLLAFYSLLIFIRIIFSWGMVGRGNRVMRFLIKTTDPLLEPLRRIIPPLGVFDISALVAFFILWLFQAAIAGTLLRGWDLRPLASLLLIW